MDNLIRAKNIDNVAHLIGHERFQIIRPRCHPNPIRRREVDRSCIRLLASPRTISTTRFQTLKVGALALTRPLAWPERKRPDFFLPPPPRSTAISEHPQSESYPGNVDTIALRGSMTSQEICRGHHHGLHRTHAVPTRIARIFIPMDPACDRCLEGL